jgi:hypothetical protein
MNFRFFLNKLKNKIRKKQDTSFNSAKYWDSRYVLNGNSGIGSYGRLAKFKARILNDFVEKRNILNIIEFGCGDGNQYSLANYDNYIGFDVSEKAIQLCSSKFRDSSNAKFYWYNKDVFYKKYGHLKADLCLSLDVIYHLIEDKVYEDHMSKLFASSKKYVIIYSSNYIEIKSSHVRCRKFTSWIEDNVSDVWSLESIVKNDYPYNVQNTKNTSMADFFFYKRNDN